MQEDATNIARRKNIRADFHDYSGGEYFVTICTFDREHDFGEISNGIMNLSALGRYCEKQLEELCVHYPYCEIPMFVVMPNHLHAIIYIKESDKLPIERSALSVIIGGLKRSVTMFARRNGIPFSWHGRYHDHIIRGQRDRNNIADYIENNVARWDSDCYND